MAPYIGGTRLIHDGWARFLVAEVTMADGTRVKREIEDHGRAVAVLPYDPARRMAVLISQFRAPVLYADGPPEMIEAPAGILDEGHPEDGAREGAPFIRSHMIRATTKAFDDFAASTADAGLHARVLGLDE